MTIPGKRLAKRRKHLRASHAALKPLALRVCPKCKKSTLPHHVCAFCGYYRGRSFMGSSAEARAVKPAAAEATPQSSQAATPQKAIANDARGSKDTSDTSSSSATPSANAL